MMREGVFRYAYDWNGHAPPQVRAVQAREMGALAGGYGSYGDPYAVTPYIAVGDWPPVITSGPERGVDDGVATRMRLMSGHPPGGGRKYYGVGDALPFLPDGMATPLVYGGIGFAIWWFYFRKPSKKKSKLSAAERKSRSLRNELIRARNEGRRLRRASGGG
jgi:hypothetical protein